MSEALKPCPFCGGDAELVEQMYRTNRIELAFWVRCTGKRCPTGPATNLYCARDYAIAAWNKRKE